MTQGEHLILDQEPDGRGEGSGALVAVAVGVGPRPPGRCRWRSRACRREPPRVLGARPRGRCRWGASAGTARVVTWAVLPWRPRLIPTWEPSDARWMRPDVVRGTPRTGPRRAKGA